MDGGMDLVGVELAAGVVFFVGVELLVVVIVGGKGVLVAVVGVVFFVDVVVVVVDVESGTIDVT